MKKFILILVVAICLCLLTCIASCGNPTIDLSSDTSTSSTNTDTQSGVLDSEVEHTHVFGEWSVVTKPTCTEVGKEERHCSCKETEYREIEATGHTLQVVEGQESTCSVEGLGEGVICTVCNEVVVEQSKLPLKNHEYNEGVCSMCNSNRVNEGLLFTLSATKDYYVFHGIGSCTDTEIYIPGEYKGLPVKEVVDYALNSCSNLTEIVVGEGISKIGTCAFSNCSSLKSLILPDSLTEFSIWETFRDGNDNLQYNELNGVYYIGTKSNPYAFLIKAAPHFNSATLEINENTKYICSSAFFRNFILEHLTIPQGVVSIGSGCFSSCSKLSSVSIPNSVKQIGLGSFDGCPKLAEVHITDLNSWCRIDFNGYASNPLNSGGKLYLNNELVTIVNVEEDIEKINQYAFNGCSSIVEVSLPKSITTVDEYAFYNCKSLKTVNIAGTLTRVGTYAFTGCDSLEFTEYEDGRYLGSSDNPYNILVKAVSSNAKIHKDTKIIYSTAFSGLFIGEIEIPNGVVSIGYGAFRDCISLKKVVLPDSVEEICYIAFSNCQDLIDIKLNSGLKFIGDEAFSNCKSLVTMTIPGSVESIGESAFAGCSGISLFVLKEGISAIGMKAFDGCTSLETVFLPDSLTSVGPSIFIRCNKIKYNEHDNAYYLGNENNPYFALVMAKDTGITSCQIHNDTKIIFPNAFANCTILETVTIGENVNTIDYGAFRGCTSLKSIVIPSNVEKIGEEAFMDCSSLESVTLVEGLKIIEQSAFVGCASLKNIVVPSSVEIMQFGVFFGNSELVVYCCAQNLPIGWSAQWSKSVLSVVWGYND